MKQMYEKKLEQYKEYWLQGFTCYRSSKRSMFWVSDCGRFLIRFPVSKREVVCWDCGAAGTTKREPGVSVEFTDVIEKFDPEPDNCL